MLPVVRFEGLGLFPVEQGSEVDSAHVDVDCIVARIRRHGAGEMVEGSSEVEER